MSDNEHFSLQITQASLNQTNLDWPQNMANHYAMIDIGADKGSDLVVAHELSLTGYEVNDEFERTDNNRIFDALYSLASYAYMKDPNMIVSVGAPWRLQLRDAFEQAAGYNPDFVKNALYDRMNLPFNVQVLLSGGHVVGMTAKANLYRNGRGHENRNFNEWSFRDVNEYARLANISSTYGTIPIILPDGRTIPIGRPLIFVTDRNGHNYVHGQAICEDKWVVTKFDSYPNNDSRYERMNIIPTIARYLGTSQGLLLEIPNASPPSQLKQDMHMHLNNLASQHADVVIDTDGLGTSGATFAQYGHRLISQNGITISAGKRMQFGHVATTTSTIRIQSAPEELETKTHAVLVREFRNSSAEPKAKLIWDIAGSGAEWDSPDNLDRWKEERIRNIALWKFDYMRKCGSKRRTNALSGGQDSGFNCTTEYVMACIGMEDLGVEEFCNYMELPYTDEIIKAYNSGGKKAAIKAFMDNYLITYYMPTNNSSQETLEAARALIEGGIDETTGERYEGIGGRFEIRNVQDLVTMCALVFGVENSSQMQYQRKMDLMLELSTFVHASPYEYTPEKMKEWETRLRREYPELKELTSVALPGHEVGYENFQARVRTVLIWAASNVSKAMPEANPNLDEAYGAYATNAGDLQAGGMNSNGGTHKSDEQSLLHYLEKKGLQNVLPPIKALRLINGNRPSAELLPKKDGAVAQFDEEALQGTFEQKAILSRLLHLSKIKAENGERRMNAGEIFAQARTKGEFHLMDDNQLFNAITYFYQRWYGPAQHKVYFAPIAPTFGENVDKQTSLRTANLGSGSQDEITQLGIDLLYKWANEDRLGWDKDTYRLLSLRAWQDKSFIRSFYARMRNSDKNIKNMDYNLRKLYEALKDKGWNAVFEPLASSHPVARVFQSKEPV